MDNYTNNEHLNKITTKILFILFSMCIEILFVSTIHKLPFYKKYKIPIISIITIIVMYLLTYYYHEL